MVEMYLVGLFDHHAQLKPAFKDDHIADYRQLSH
jgi:hypothetical protein